MNASASAEFCAKRSCPRLESVTTYASPTVGRTNVMSWAWEALGASPAAFSSAADNATGSASESDDASRVDCPRTILSSETPGLADRRSRRERQAYSRWIGRPLAASSATFARPVRFLSALDVTRVKTVDPLTLRNSAVVTKPQRRSPDRTPQVRGTASRIVKSRRYRHGR